MKGIALWLVTCLLKFRGGFLRVIFLIQVKSLGMAAVLPGFAALFIDFISESNAKVYHDAIVRALE